MTFIQELLEQLKQPIAEPHGPGREVLVIKMTPEQARVFAEEMKRLKAEDMLQAPEKLET